MTDAVPLCSLIPGRDALALCTVTLMCSNHTLLYLHKLDPQFISMHLYAHTHTLAVACQTGQDCAHSVE